jgi:hypothetical protein
MIKMKRFIIILTLVLAIQTAYGQDTVYKKIYLSVSGGKDFPIGTPNSGFTCDNEYYPFPLAKGTGLGFNGAYFFSQHYGIGLKYHFFTAKFEDNETFDPNNQYSQYSFHENIHLIGPAIYGRWILGNSRWDILANESG